jgi:hypothetical protein
VSDSAWAAELVEAFRKEKPDAARLAELASIAVRIDAPLLRALRHELWPQADPGAEADLWFSPLVQAHDREACVLHEAVLLKLREDLANEPARLRRAAQVVKQVHTYLPEASQLEEELTALALSGLPDVDARTEEALRPALRALASEGSGDTAEHAQRALEAARWAMSAVWRLPAPVRDSPAAHTLLLGAALRLEDPGIAATLSEQAVPVESLSWLLPAGNSDSPAEIGVSLLPNGVRFESPETATHVIEMPDTNPALVSVRWTTGSQTHSSMVNAVPGTFVETGTTPVPIEIVTLAGDVYRLTVGSAPSAADGETATEQTEQEVRLPPPLDCLVEVQTLGSQGGPWVAIPVDEDLWITSLQSFGETPFLAPYDDGSQFRVLNFQDKDTPIRVLKPLSPRSETPLSQDSEQNASALLATTGVAALTIGTVQDRRGKFYAVQAIKAGVEGPLPALVASSEPVALNVIGAPLLNEGLLVGMVLKQTEGPVFEVASLKEINQVVARAKSIYEASKRLEPARDEPAYPNRGSIYISHSRADQELVRKVADRLSARGLHPFVDLTELKADDPWEAKRRDALRESTLVLVLVTPAFLESEWAIREVDFAVESKVPTFLTLYRVTSSQLSASRLAGADNQLHFSLDDRDLDRSLDLLSLQVENKVAKRDERPPP